MILYRWVSAGMAVLNATQFCNAGRLRMGKCEMHCPITLDYCHVSHVNILHCSQVASRELLLVYTRIHF